jgi:hypothetical protein
VKDQTVLAAATSGDHGYNRRDCNTVWLQSPLSGRRGMFLISSASCARQSSVSVKENQMVGT